MTPSSFSERRIRRVRTTTILALCLACLIRTAFSASAATGQPSDAARKPAFIVLNIDNKIIGPVIADYIDEGIKQAAEQGAQGVILVLDTPGGLLESTRTIVKKIMNAPVPVITYIAPSGSRAGSAGVFITLASHVAAMAPSTNIGAAHPVTIDGTKKEEHALKKAVEELTQTLRSQKKQKTKTPQQEAPPPPDHRAPETGALMEDKVLNDTIAWVETIAKNRGRNASWAKQAVLKSVSATEREALEKQVIDLIATDLNDLLQKIDAKVITMADGETVILKTRDARLTPFDLTARQNILNTLIDPNIAYILMMIGLLGLFIEITNPGVVFPGIAGVICLILAFYAFAILPVNFAGFLLIGLAVILLIAEVLTPATFGLLSLSGLIAMLLGSLLLVDASFSGLSVSLNIILPIVCSVAAIMLFLITSVVKAHRKKVMTGSESLIDALGEAGTDLTANGEGQVFVNGEIWSARNTGPGPIKKGEKIKVVGIDKVKLLVTK